MPKNKSKTAKLLESMKNQTAQIKDDGTRWIVERDGVQVYPGPGVSQQEAIQLEAGLVKRAEIRQIK